MNLNLRIITYLLFWCLCLNVGAQRIKELEGDPYKNLEYYCDHTTKQYANLVEMLRKHIGVDSLKFNTIEIIRDAIGLPKDQICTHCFDGSSYGHE